jgi:hypothetical protein
MSDEIEGDVDLWGDPWTPPKDRRGRKRHRWLKQVAENVAVLKASGQTVEVIASRIGLSEPTLRKYYFRELEEGADLAQAVLNEAMWRKAINGNVSAARYIREEFGKGPAKAAANRVRHREVKEVPMGKKAERQAAAERVGGLYATPAPPQAKQH